MFTYETSRFYLNSQSYQKRPKFCVSFIVSIIENFRLSHASERFFFLNFYHLKGTKFQSSSLRSCSKSIQVFRISPNSVHKVNNLKNLACNFDTNLIHTTFGTNCRLHYSSTKQSEKNILFANLHIIKHLPVFKRFYVFFVHWRKNLVSCMFILWVIFYSAVFCFVVCFVSFEVWTESRGLQVGHHTQ